MQIFTFLYKYFTYLLLLIDLFMNVINNYYLFLDLQFVSYHIKLFFIKNILIKYLKDIYLNLFLIF